MLQRFSRRAAVCTALLLTLALLLAPAQAAPTQAPGTVRAGGHGFAATPADLPADLRDHGNLYLVQFSGPIEAAWLDGVTALGATVHQYIPRFAFVVGMDGTIRDRVAACPQVAWVGPYYAAYRIDPSITPDCPAGRFEATVLPGYGAVDVAAAAAAAGLDARAEGDVVVLEGTGADARALAGTDGIAWIHPFQAPQLYNHVVRGIIKSDVVQAHGITGAGDPVGGYPPRQIAAITDTGVYDGHECFTRPGKLVAYIDIAGDGPGDGHGHGTHCAGTVLGDAPTFDQWNKYDGHGPGADYIAVKVFTNAGSWAGGSNYYGFWLAAYNEGARANSNSWGANTGGAYTTSSQHADQVSWDRRDYLLSIAAGNAGTGGPNSVGSPATAKDCVTVGATEKTNPENVAYFSSRGPTDDGRIKPDVMAPGVGVRSAQTNTYSGYVSMSGTSMATPAVAGAATLVRDYYILGYYPRGVRMDRDGFPPSSALVKATLINGAVEMTGVRSDWNNEGVYPNNAQGWGRIDLDNSLYFAGDTRLMQVWDCPASLVTGDVWEAAYTLPRIDRALKVTLVWTDYAGATLINDLNLTVVAPDGTVYRGNNFVGLNPGYSVAGGTCDATNNVEGVHLIPGHTVPYSLPLGHYRILVEGYNVPQPGSNFAVVVTEYDYNAPEPPVGRIALMGDYKDQLHKLLLESGFEVQPYEAGDYTGVLANLGYHDAVIIHRTPNHPGLDRLLDVAEIAGKGLVFLSSYPVESHAMGVLDARYQDPAYTRAGYKKGPVVLLVERDHPLFEGFKVGDKVCIIKGGRDDYQSYGKYSGSNIGLSLMQDPGGIEPRPRWFIGVKWGRQESRRADGARHVVMGSFGACEHTNVDHWTKDGIRIFRNAVAWAAKQ